MTFIAQLIQFYKRLYQEAYESLPVSPRVFIVSSHELEDPEYIIARMVSIIITISINLFLDDGKPLSR